MKNILFIRFIFVFGIIFFGANAQKTRPGLDLPAIKTDLSVIDSPQSSDSKRLFESPSNKENKTPIAESFSKKRSERKPRRSFTDVCTFVAPKGITIRPALHTDAKAIRNLAQLTLRSIFNPMIEKINAEEGTTIPTTEDDAIDGIDGYNIAFLPLHECLVAVDEKSRLLGFIVTRIDSPLQPTQSQQHLYDSYAEKMKTRYLDKKEKFLLEDKLGAKKNVIHIELLEVNPSCTGKGIGTFLINAAVEQTKSASSYFLEVLKNNPARSLYSKIGFSIFDDSKALWSQTGFIIMSTRARILKDLLKSEISRLLARDAA